MKEIWEIILNPGWWFGTVIVAFLINLASDYSKPAIDNWLSKYSRAKRDVNEKKRREFEELLSKLMSDPVEVVLAEVRYTRSLIQSGFSFTAVLIGGLIQSVATELRLSPYLDFMSDATVITQMFLKNNIIFGFLSTVLVLGCLFATVMLVVSNRQHSFLRELLSEYQRRKRVKG